MIPSRSISIPIAFLVISLSQPSLGAEPAKHQQTLNHRLTALAQRYQIEFVVVDTVLSDPESYTSTTHANYSEFSRIMAEQLAIYPTNFPKRIGLKRILLCGGIHKDGMSLRGTADTLAGTIVYDASQVNDGGGADNAETKITIHHELFHVIDHALHFDPVRRAYSDPGWKSINPKGFLYYIQGGASPEPLGLDSSVPGFLTGYSRSNVLEDKAVLYSLKMIRPDIVDPLARSDDRLGRKCVLIESMVQKLIPEIDAGFWKGRRKSIKSAP